MQERVRLKRRRRLAILDVASFSLRAAFKNRLTLLLFLVLLVLFSASVGMRLQISEQGFGSFQRIHALVERPTISRVASWGIGFLQPIAVPRGAQPASVLFSNEGTRHDISTTSLAGVMVIALPIAMLLIGVSMAPSRGGAICTMRTTPHCSPVLFLGHALGLMGFVVCTMALGWGLGALLLFLGGEEFAAARGQLSAAFLYSSLYAFLFALIGLWLGVWMKSRVVAALTGLALIILLVGIFPNLGELLTETYFDAHPELVQPVRDTGIWPDDWLFIPILGIRHTPSNALHRILGEIADPTPIVLDRQCQCRVAWSSEKIILEEVIALSAATAIALFLGILAFAVREVSES